MDSPEQIVAMTPTVVVDASALAAVAFREPLAPDVAKRLAKRRLVAPKLLVYELVNTALKKLRVHPDQRPLILGALGRLLGEDFAIYWSDVEPLAVLELAERTGLTAYDASYLWLARHLDAELVTLDAELDAVARSEAG